MKKIFLSHKTQDKPLAKEIKKALERLNFKVWFDVTALYPGDQWPKAIAKGVYDTDVMVVLWTREAEADPHWIEFEYNTALALRKQVIPVSFSSVKLPIELISIQAIDFSSPKQTANEIQRRKLRAAESYFFKSQELVEEIGKIREADPAKALEKLNRVSPELHKRKFPILPWKKITIVSGLTIIFFLSIWLSLFSYRKPIKPNLTTATSTSTFTKETVDAIGKNMIFIPGGTFKMGSKDYDDEKPIHNVTLRDFYIGKYEVTQKQWVAIMGYNPSHFNGCIECPVEKVSWNDVQKFIEKLNKNSLIKYRLPTEAEWEYAASLGKPGGLSYSGSANIDDVAWYVGNSKSKTNNVGRKNANRFGLYDMSGNVSEWCNDWYGSGYYVNSPSQNPKGPSIGIYRVVRGGSWSNFEDRCRVSNRGGGYFPCYWSSQEIGFRLAKTVP